MFDMKRKLNSKKFGKNRFMDERGESATYISKQTISFFLQIQDIETRQNTMVMKKKT